MTLKLLPDCKILTVSAYVTVEIIYAA